MKQKLLSFILVFTLFIGVSHAQDFTVKGKVTSSSDGSAISGVSVIVQGTNKATQTDADGNYSISATANASLVFRFVGFASQTIKVTRQMQLNVVLNNDEHALEEVVVVAYGSAKKESLTGSISSITSKDLEKDLLQMLWVLWKDLLQVYRSIIPQVSLVPNQRSESVDFHL